MVISTDNAASGAAHDDDDISITPQPDFPIRINAFSNINSSKKSLMDQIRNAEAVTTLPSNVAQYPKIITGPESRQYHLRAHFFDKPRPSWISNHGTFLIRLARDSSGAQDGQFWACHKCGRLYDAEATSSAAKHLNGQHLIFKDGEALPPANTTSKRNAPIDALFQAQSSKKAKLPSPADKKEQFKEHLINWMADADISFAMVENKRFRELLSLINPIQVDDFLPKSHTTPRVWLKTIYNREFEVLRSQLTANSNPIHISFDGWSSPGAAAFFAVVAHYFDALGGYNTKLLALPRIKGTHNGENLAKGVIEVVERFGFQSKLGFFQADNADNNDTCITALIQHFNPHFVNHEVDSLKSQQRVRCVGHILNLIARAFLDGENKETIKRLAEGSQEQLSAVEERELLTAWRETGPVGKLHYLVHFVRRTPQRRDVFNDLTNGNPPSKIIKNPANFIVGKLFDDEEEDLEAILIDPGIRNLQLKADNDTRWHSVYYMIERALILRDPLTKFSTRFINLGQLSDDAVLSTEDWAVLIEIKAILAPFKFITKKFEGRKCNFSDVVPHFFTLHRDLQHLYQQYTAEFEQSRGFDSSIFPPNIDRPVGRLPEFPAEPGTAPAPARPRRIPRIPTRFADYNIDLPGIRPLRPNTPLPPYEPRIELGTPMHDDLEVPSFSSLQSSLQYAIDKLEKYLGIMDRTPAYWAALILHPGRRMKWAKMFYEGDDARILDIERRFITYFYSKYATADATASPRPSNQVPGFGDTFYDTPVANGVLDEVKEYLRGQVYRVDDPIQWWIAKKTEYPQLWKMALEVLSIPPCATECERTFSLTKLTIGSQRHCCGDDTLSWLQCLRNWLRGRGL